MAGHRFYSRINYNRDSDKEEVAKKKSMFSMASI